MFRKRLEELYEIHKKDNAFFEEISIKKDNFRKLFSENSNPNLKTLFKIAAVANVKVSWIIGETSDKEIAERIKDANSKLEAISEELKQKNEILEIRKSQLTDKERIIESYENWKLALQALSNEKDNSIQSLKEQITFYKSIIEEKEFTITELTKNKRQL